MTDKTKPWLTATHPEALACKEAGLRLYEELAKLGVDLTGRGVTLSDDQQSAAIRIMVMTPEDKNKIPLTFEGYEVKTVVTGVIKAL